MLGGVLFTRTHLHVEHQTEVTDHEGVVGVRGAARLVGVVAHLRALLVPEDRLDRGVHVEDPRSAESREPGVAQGLPLPPSTGLLIHMGEGPSNAVLAADLGHAKALRVDGVGTQGRDVGIAELAGEDREGDGAEQVGDRRGVGAAEAQRAAADPFGEEPRGGEELAEEDQLAQGRHGRLRIPLDVKAASVGVDHDRRRGERGSAMTCQSSFTPRVRPQNSRRSLHPPHQDNIFRAPASLPTAVSRLNRDVFQSLKPHAF